MLHMQPTHKLYTQQDCDKGSTLSQLKNKFPSTVILSNQYNIQTSLVS